MMVWVPAAEIKIRNRNARADELKVGDEVNIVVFTFK
jgi:hypothetical protein